VTWFVAEPSASYLLSDGSDGVTVRQGSGTATFRSAKPRFSLRVEAPGRAGVPDGFRLEQNYPNPFNPVTTIAYDLPRRSAVRLTIHDNLGREVALLADGEQADGPHAVAWDASGHASGVYLYRLTVDGVSTTRKMLLMK
jgi:hypothetical protein